MRVLVTGASGFVGRACLHALTELGCEVIAASRRPGPPAPGVEWTTVDLLAPGEAARLGREARADTLLHLGWTVDPGRFWTDPANLDWLGATLKLVRAAAEAGARRVVGVGTCFEYDWPVEGDCHELTTGLRTHTLYDAAKDACRRTLEAYAAQERIAFAWGRLFYLYGPGEDPARLVPGLARALLAGEPARLSSGLAVRDYMDVRDAGRSLALLATHTLEGPANIATGQGVSIAGIAREMADLAGRPDLVMLGALPDRPGEPARIVADVSRQKEALGFIPSISLRQGLNDALAHWRSRAI